MSKRGLVLSGGGVMGAAQLGCLASMAKREPNLDYDVITGISAGAMNGGILCQSPRGQFVPYIQKGTDIWFGITGNDDIWKAKPFAVLQLLFTRSLRTATPRRRLVERNMDREAILASGRQLRIGAVRLGKGTYEEGTEKSPNLVDWIMASSSVPIFFPPTEVNGNLYIDGCIRETLAINTALSLGCDKVDIITTGPPVDRYSELVDSDLPNVISIMERVLSLMFDEIVLTDYPVEIESSVEATVYGPKKKLLPSGFDKALNFYPSTIRQLYKEGEGFEPISWEDWKAKQQSNP